LALDGGGFFAQPAIGGAFAHQIGFDHVFGGAALFVLLMAVVFLLPIVLPQSSQTTQQVVTTILYILGPIGGVVQGLSGVAGVEAGIAHLYELESKLDAALEPHHRQPVTRLQQFAEIKLEAVRMRHKSWLHRGNRSGVTPAVQRGEPVQVWHQCVHYQ
jgi:ABC-type siderophore export system fused ATPase/permease subunit